MKKNLFLCFFVLFFANYIFAQDADLQKNTYQFPKNEFHLSFGDPAVSLAMMDNWLWGGYYDSPPYYGNNYDWFSPIVGNKAQKFVGSFSLSYYHRLKKWFWLGGTASITTTFGGQSFDVQTKEPLGSFNSTYFGFAPAIRFSYLNRKNVTLYSGLSLGLACIFEADSKIYSYYGDSNYKDYGKRIHTRLHLYQQFTFFGVSFGNKIFGNVELGVGNKGIFSVGLGYKF